MAFAVLLVPAMVTLTLLVIARLLYSRPEDLDVSVPNVKTEGLPRVFWIYLPEPLWWLLVLPISP